MPLPFANADAVQAAAPGPLIPPRAHRAQPQPQPVTALPCEVARPEWQTVFSLHCELGESPFWHPQERMLYWVDIAGKQLLRGNPASGAFETWDMPCEPGCIAPVHWVGGLRDSSAQAQPLGSLVVALRSGIYLAAHWGGTLKLLSAAPFDTSNTRFNDGKADPDGRFWAGTYFEPRNAPAATLWCLDLRQPPSPRSSQPVLTQMLGEAKVANGLAWSPDSHVMYWADTGMHQVGAWTRPAGATTAAFEAGNGTRWAEQRDWARFAPKSSDALAYGGRPDGAAVDEQGNYWVAMFEGGGLLQLAPSGAVLQRIATPVLRPTMPCFGGADRKTLYVTTARHGRPLAESMAADQQAAGQIFATRVPVPGLPVHLVHVHECYK